MKGEPMEKSRAIELLEYLAWDRDIERNPCGDAINIAIDALRQSEPCGDKSYALWKESYEELKRRMDELTSCSDTISRQAAIDICANAIDLWHGQLGEGALVAVRDKIAELPSAQPEPKEGHWIEGGIYRDVIECNCSECGQLMTTAATVRMNYCPNCGAKMKGAQNE